MYCAQCGNEISDRVKFCPQCGSSTGINVSGGTPSSPRFYLADVKADTANNVEAANSSKQRSTSFKDAMDAIRSNSKRRILMIMMLVLVLALLAGCAAYTGYYIYNNYFAQQPNEQPMETISEPAAAMAAYTNVLDEYRDFLAFVTAEGDVKQGVNNLARNRRTYELIDYPDVSKYYLSSSGTIFDCNKYAYFDFDDNGTPELVVGNGSNQPLEVYAYQDGKVVDLFGLSAEGSWRINNDGYITNTGSKGREENYAIYALDDNTLEPLETATLEYDDDAFSKGRDLYVIRHTTADGIEDTRTTYDYDEATETLREFLGQFFISPFSWDWDAEVALDWQDL